MCACASACVQACTLVCTHTRVCPRTSVCVRSQELFLSDTEVRLQRVSPGPGGEDVLRTPRRPLQASYPSSRGAGPSLVPSRWELLTGSKAGCLSPWDT